MKEIKLNFKHQAELLPQDKENVEKAAEKFFGVDETVATIEIPKTKEAERILSFAINLVSNYVRELEVEPIDFSVDKIHLMKSDDYKNKFKALETDTACYFPQTANIYLRSGVKQKTFKSFEILIHELVHAFSYNRRYVAIKNDKYVMSNDRTGYGVTNQKDKHEHFRGMNEAVTQLITTKIIKSNLDSIKETLRPNEEDVEEWRNYFDYYEGMVEVFLTVVNGLSSSQSDFDNKLREFEQKYFTGEMMQFREIESYYGKGSLRVLSVLGEKNPGLSQKENIYLVKEYFSTNNLERRQQIAGLVSKK